MAEEKPPSKAKEYLAAHGEKLGLVLAILLVLGYLGYEMALSEPDPTARNTRQLLDRVNGEMARAHDTLQPPKEAKPWQANSLDEYTKVPEIGEPPPNSAGTFFTRGVPNRIEKAVVKTKRVVMPGVTILEPSVELGKITVSWEIEQIGDKDVEIAPVDSFILERREKGGSWNKIGSGLEGATSYEDTDIKPKHEYEYRITPVTSDSKFKLKEGTDKGQMSEVVQAQALGVFKLRIINAMSGLAYIEVEKYEKDVGTVKKSFLTKPGDPIGMDPKTSSYDHYVPPVAGGRAVKVNFKTGYKLVSVTEVALKLKKIKHNIKYGAGGVPESCEQTEDTIPHTTKEIVYTDEEEKQHRIYHPPPPDVSEGACPVCGTGQKIKMDLDDEKPAEEKKPLTREDQARELLHKADALWRKDKDAAKKIYKDLLAGFKDTKIIQKNEKKIRAKIE